VRLLALVVVPLLLPVLVACTGDGDEPAAAPSSPATTSAASPTASVPPPPPQRGCYRLTYDQAIAPNARAKAVPCGEQHTAVTFAVGEVDALVDGHLLAVDSARVQEQVATECPSRFGAFVGGTLEDQRLAMLRPVWFTPSLQASDAGASWFRCDAVALATDEELAPLTERLDGVLDSEAGRDRYGMCGTARPGTPDFAHVICAREHSWRAIAVVPFETGPYPGVSAVRSAGESPCQDAGAAAAGGALDYEWGYEWPSEQQWRAGQTFGRCWAPG
jgi:Septum formation